MASKKRLLIVEDESPLLEILVEKFESSGFETLKAQDGEEGLSSALLNHPDLILLDIILPKMDGIEMLRRLRTDAWGKDAAVVLLTNLSDSDKVAEATRYQVYDFLVKSDWKLEDVVEKVKDKLKM